MVLSVCHGTACACLGEVMRSCKIILPEIADSEMYQTDLFSFGIVNFHQIFTGRFDLLDICKLTVQPVALTFRVVI